MTDSAMLRVLLVEDHEMVAHGSRPRSPRRPTSRSSASREPWNDGVNRFKQLRPHVVVMDYRLPDGEGTDATRRIREVDPDARRPAAHRRRRPQRRVRRARRGCSGFVTKDRGVEDLVSAIRSVAKGAAVFPTDLLVRA